MTLSHPYIKAKIEEWQNELRLMTGDGSLQLIPRRDKPLFSKEEVEEVVTIITGVTLERIQKKSRKREVVRARHILAFNYMDKCEMSSMRVGKELNRDHSTILYAEKTVLKSLKSGGTKLGIMASMVEEEFAEMAKKNPQ